MYRVYHHCFLNTITKQVGILQVSNLYWFIYLYVVDTSNVSIKYCSKCNTKFKNIRGSREECKNCMIPLFWRCLKCDMRYEHRSSLEYHLISKCNPRRFYKCSKCDYTTSVKRQLNKHGKHECLKDSKQWKNQCQRNTLSVPRSYCKFCPYTTAYKVNLKAHVRKKHHRVISNNGTKESSLNNVKDHSEMSSNSDKILGRIINNDFRLSIVVNYIFYGALSLNSRCSQRWRLRLSQTSFLYSNSITK